MKLNADVESELDEGLQCAKTFRMLSGKDSGKKTAAQTSEAVQSPVVDHETYSSQSVPQDITFHSKVSIRDEDFYKCIMALMTRCLQNAQELKEVEDSEERKGNEKEIPS